VSNTRNVDLTACSITDTPDLGTAGAVSNIPFDLANGAPAHTTSAVDITGAASTFTNHATVTCNAATGGTVTDSTTANCVVPPPPGNCITRTPGYYGTHPNQTDAIIALAGGSVASCGISITSATGALPNTTQDLCFNNFDADQNNTSSQQVSLIQQCMAAALNLELSGKGVIADGITACQAFPNIGTIFNNCCVGPTSTCDSGAKFNVISNSGCQTALDNFNNQFDNVSFPQGFINEAANSSFCSAATGDGVVNPGRNLGPSNKGKK